jgi:hypothetical protein
MRLVAKPSIDLAPLEAFRASMRLWLVEILVWLAHFLDAKTRAPKWLAAAFAAAERELDRDLRDSVRDLRMLLLAHAFAHMPVLSQTAFNRTPRPSGLRRHVSRNSFLRKVTATALKNIHSGSLKQRAERLRALLENPEPPFAEARAHMLRLFTDPRLPGLNLRIVNVAVRTLVRPAPPAPADTS